MTQLISKWFYFMMTCRSNENLSYLQANQDRYTWEGGTVFKQSSTFYSLLVFRWLWEGLQPVMLNKWYMILKTWNIRENSFNVLNFSSNFSKLFKTQIPKDLCPLRTYIWKIKRQCWLPFMVFIHTKESLPKSGLQGLR